MRQAQPPRFEPRIVPDRRSRADDLRLANIRAGLVPDAGEQLFFSVLRQSPADNRAASERCRNAGRIDRARADAIRRIANGRAGRTTRCRRWEVRIPRRGVRGRFGEVGHEGRRFEKTTAQGVGDGDLPFADGLDQAGDAELRVGLELERIGLFVGNAAEDHVDRQQSAQRLQKHLAAADGEIAPFRQ